MRALKKNNFTKPKMCTLCAKCTESTVCYCVRCPFNPPPHGWPARMSPQCDVCGVENCKSESCGFVLHALSSGEDACLKCIDEEYEVSISHVTIYTPCKRHK